MITTEGLQRLTRPKLARVFAALGQQIAIVRVQDDPTATPDDYGQRPKVTVKPTVIGVAYQLDPEKRARLAAGGSVLEVPDWEVILPFEAPVAEPGFVLHVHDRADPSRLVVELHPATDAQDPGTQGVAWIVLCRSPRAREA